MSYPNISPQMRDQINRINKTQQQIEYVMQSKMNIEGQVKEIEFALEALEKSKEDKKIYKSVGGLLIQSDKTETTEELTERKETLGRRLKSLEKQESRLKASFEEQKEKFQARMQNQAPEEEEEE